MCEMQSCPYIFIRLCGNLLRVRTVAVMKLRAIIKSEFPTFEAFGNTLATTAVKSVLLHASSKGGGGNASASRLRK